MTGSIIIPAKSGQKMIKNKKVKQLYKKIIGSIIGPAMAGPTGPFATALLYDNYPPSPALGVSLLQTIFADVGPDVIYPPHSSFGYLSLLHPRRLLHLVSFIHPRKRSTPVQPGLPRFQCDVFNCQFSSFCRSSLSLCKCHTFGPPQHSNFWSLQKLPTTSWLKSLLRIVK